VIVEKARSLADWMAERQVSAEVVLAATGLDRKVLDAIVHGRYTPSPRQRQLLAQALGLEPAEIIWGHTQQVDHMYGHGPQFGRSP